MIDFPNITDVGQLTRKQREVLGRAVRRGELARYRDPFFGPPPWTSNPA